MLKYYILLSLISAPLVGVEVHTNAPSVTHASDRQHYALYAKRFSDMLMTHPPVSDCHVMVHDSALEIAVEINRPTLVQFLTENHGIRFVSPRDLDRYLDSFKVHIRNSASEIFTEIEQQAINITLQVKDEIR